MAIRSVSRGNMSSRVRPFAVMLPSPVVVRRTRATAVFLLPVATMISCAMLYLVTRFYLQTLFETFFARHPTWGASSFRGAALCGGGPPRQTHAGGYSIYGPRAPWATCRKPLVPRSVRGAYPASPA